MGIDLKERQIKVLVVDDYRVNQLRLKSLLKNFGYSAALADNGLEALDLVKKEVFDAILLDIIMPRMDGLQFLSALKAQGGFHDIPIIIVSQLDEIDNIVQGIELGAVDYITKPFSARELEVRLKNHIELKIARDKLSQKNEALEKANNELAVKTEELQKALDEIKTLRGIIPICCVCKNVRDDEGYWKQVESYITQRTEAKFSHGYCPGCAEKELEKA